MNKVYAIIKWLGIIVVTAIVERLISLIPIEDTFAAEKWQWVIIHRFNIIDLVLFIISFAVVLLLYNFLMKRLCNRENRIEKELKKHNTILDTENGVKVTWDMYMGMTYDNDPHPYNIKVFCLKHDIPQLMDHGRCLDDRCSNSQKWVNENDIKRQIESFLLNERDKLIKK